MIDILVPVLRRPLSVTPLVESIHAATTTDYRIHFICTRGDAAEIDAVRATGLEPLVHPEQAGPANFARKINWAFDLTDAEWVFQGADDLRFHPGWDTNALRCSESTRKRVIGTNDLHNPGVKKGRTSTHTLFARSYIEECGGTFDDSGRVFHEGYDHQFVDNEFCETAKARGEWAFALDAIVEHFHPHWGNAPSDETYRKATRRTREDRDLHTERMRTLYALYPGLNRRARYSSRR